jgi:hypothetical protein
MTLPPIDPERNREVIAERLGWPPGAVQACRDLEAHHPGWRVHYDTGGHLHQPDSEYVAQLAEPWHGYRPRLSAPDPAGLGARIAEEDARRPW